jgi:4'-phosphopantetheinyl transferase
VSRRPELDAPRSDAIVEEHSHAVRDAERRRLEANHVAVWLRFTDALSADDLSAMDRILPREERLRRDRFVFHRDRRDFSAAHALLRTALSHYGDLPPAEWRFQTNQYGKPRLVPAQAHEAALVFNLSHTAGLVACAIARATRIGIDVENCDQMADALQLAPSYFTSSECELLAPCGRDDAPIRFTELWTLKESYIKAVGVGLSLPLNSFAFSFRGASGLEFACKAGEGQWQFWLAAPARRARLAIAVPLTNGDAVSRITFHHAEDLDQSASPVTLLRSTHGS